MAVKTNLSAYFNLGVQTFKFSSGHTSAQPGPSRSCTGYEGLVAGRASGIRAGLTPAALGTPYFATVYSLRGQPFVYEVVHVSLRTAELRAEFSLMYGALRFRRREPRQVLSSALFTHFGSTAYIMDRAHALLPRLVNTVRGLFYSAHATVQDVPTPPTMPPLLRQSYRPSRFVNSANFPLDINRYTALVAQSDADTLSPLEDVAAGMGAILSRIHWQVGYDGREIEFVVAGSGIPGCARYYLIDFNQMRPFRAEDGDIQGLADVFFMTYP
ncbi:hypothetical protein C2E23DRAFT_861121 [Lenzites betulinus]|nr:hypothetical protein C2E23DRAFT_861121 [Lenzites betulinus]